MKNFIILLLLSSSFYGQSQNWKKLILALNSA